jgi:hypothetical protein
MRLDNSSSYQRKLARAFVYSAMGFDKINQVLTFGLCPSCISQNSGPFASGFVVNNLGIGRAEYHDSEWF